MATAEVIAADAAALREIASARQLPEVAVIADSLRPGGAIAQRPSATLIIPYWGNYATLGLAALVASEPSDASRNGPAARVAWRWLDWYQSHQKPATGYVHDYDGARELPSADSTDAYAGTYLLALEAMWKATQCIPCARRHRDGVARAFTAITSTQDADGLTWAKPDGRVKYLIDQAEVAAGLGAAERLAASEPLFDATLQARARAARAHHLEGLARMLEGGIDNLIWAIADNEATATTFVLRGPVTIVDWTRYYPDSISPLFVAALVPEVNRALSNAVVARFVSTFPEYAAHPDIWGFPVVAALALKQSGRKPEADAAVARLRGWVAGNYRGPALTSGHAGQLLVAALVP